MRLAVRTTICITIAFCFLTGFTGISYSDELLVTEGNGPHAIMRPDWDTLTKME